MQRNPIRPEKRKPTGDYEVGYCRPPVETQFQKGMKRACNRGLREHKDSDDNTIPIYKSMQSLLNKKVYVIENGKRKAITFRDLATTKYGTMCLDRPKDLGEFLKFAERTDRAAAQGRTGEPDILIITGGLPDRDDMIEDLPDPFLDDDSGEQDAPTKGLMDDPDTPDQE